MLKFSRISIFQITVVSMIILFVMLNSESAFAEVWSLTADKDAYSMGEQITLTGIEQKGASQVTIVILDPEGSIVKAVGVFSEQNGSFEKIVSTDEFTTIGTYTATAYIKSRAEGSSVLFDFVIQSEDTSLPENESEQKSASNIEVKTNQSQYQLGNNIDVLGLVGNVITNMLLTIRILDPSGNPIQIDQFLPNADGTFSKSYLAAGPLWSSSGTFTVIANYEQLSQEAKFVFEAESEPPTTETKPSPQKTGFAQFMDPTKDPQYYVDRYNNDSAYREWFDSNFPSQTIYEATGVLPLIEKPSKIPEWVKNISLWYGQGTVSEDEFINAIRFLIQEGIIRV